MPPTSVGRGHYEMMAGVSVCLFVSTSVACRDLIRERKGLPKIGRMEDHASHMYPVNLFGGQKVKGQGHQAD